MRQVVGIRVASHPDRYGPVTRVVGQHDQVTVGLEFAVGQPPGPGLGVRDSDSSHTLKCRPRAPVLPGPRPFRCGWDLGIDAERAEARGQVLDPFC